MKRFKFTIESDFGYDYHCQEFEDNVTNQQLREYISKYLLDKYSVEWQDVTNNEEE